MAERIRWALAREVLVAALGSAAVGSSVAVNAAATKDTLEVPMMAHDGYFAERCFELTPATLKFEVDSPYAVDFNFHHHTATTTEFPIRTVVAGHYAGTLKLTVAGEYCFMWKNPADRDSEFTIRLVYDAT
jgi:hypothetical protein